MKKKSINLILTAIIGLCFVTSAFAQYRTSNSAKLVNGGAIVVTGTAAAYSKAFKTSDSSKISVMYKVSGTTPDVAISFEESYRPPTTEGTTDTGYIVTDVLTSSTTVDTYKMATVDTVNMTYGRFYLKGQAGNGVATVDLYFAK